MSRSTCGVRVVRPGSASVLEPNVFFFDKPNWCLHLSKSISWQINCGFFSDKNTKDFICQRSMNKNNHEWIRRSTNTRNSSYIKTSHLHWNKSVFISRVYLKKNHNGDDHQHTSKNLLIWQVLISNTCGANIKRSPKIYGRPSE